MSDDREGIFSNVQWLARTSQGHHQSVKAVFLVEVIFPLIGGLPPSCKVSRVVESTLNYPRSHFREMPTLLNLGNLLGGLTRI